TVAVVIGVGVVIGGPVVLDYRFPPADAVTSVLESSGDGDTSAMVGRFASDATADALGAAPKRSGHMAPSDVQIVRVVKTGYHDADVTVSYRIGDTGQNEVVGVTRAGWFAPWRIDSPPPVLRVDTQWPVPVRVAGIRKESGPVTVAPGSYTVAVDHDLFKPATETAVVGLGGGEMDMDLKLRDDATDTATTVVNDVIDECAASKEPLTVQSECPFFETQAQVIEPDAASWTVTDYPNIKLAPGDDEFAVTTTSNGKASLSLDFDNRESQTYECRFNVDGSLEIKSSDMEWTGNPIQNMDGCDKKE
ncbi:MAG: hypothetical protein ACRD0P_23750, partial [Stackebrandtia sp.]